VTVRTAYVGASADLVRGFITTPLERVIAAADGIDYIESQSTQGLSTVNVRLKLNFKPRALSPTSPPREPGTRRSSAGGRDPRDQHRASDSATAAMYLSFRSNILAENQVTDYLIPRRAAASFGDQRHTASRHPRRTHLRHSRVAEADRMAALNVSPAQVRQALASNNYLSAVGQTKGQLISRT